MINRTQRLEELLRISHRLNFIDDLDSVLDQILFEARSLTGAESGTIYLRDGDELIFEHTQNDSLFTSNLDNKNNYLNKRIPIDRHSIAGYVAFNSQKNQEKEKVINIPDVYKLPSKYPFSFDKSFDRQNDYRTESNLATSIDTTNGENIGVIQIMNQKDSKGKTIPFQHDDEIVLSSFADLAAVHIERANIKKEMILRMIKMAELRDPKETGAHVNRVGAYSAELYEHWAINNGFNTKEIKQVKGEYRMASMLHDVGKVGISDTILKKPGLFNDEEREIIKSHTSLSIGLFRNPTSDMDKLALEIAVSHHENWDGSGYPGNSVKKITYKGNNIPLSGRIVRITDVYDALMSRRCYKEPWDEQDAIDEIQKNSGSEFDPILVGYFFEIYDIIKAIHLKYKEEDN